MLELRVFTTQYAVVEHPFPGGRFCAIVLSRAQCREAVGPRGGLK